MNMRPSSVSLAPSFVFAQIPTKLHSDEKARAPQTVTNRTGRSATSTSSPPTSRNRRPIERETNPVSSRSASLNSFTRLLPQDESLRSASDEMRWASPEGPPLGTAPPAFRQRTVKKACINDLCTEQ